MTANRQAEAAKQAKTHRRPTQSSHRTSAAFNAVDSLVLPVGLLESVHAGLMLIYGSALKEVFVYGSYARGSFDQESDIDIAAIVDIPRSQLKDYRHSTVALMSEVAMKYDKLVSITEIPWIDYTNYRHALPYYRNIAEEGVLLHAG